MIRRYTRALLLTGALVAGGGAAALVASGGVNRTAAAGGVQNLSTAALSTSDVASVPGASAPATGGAYEDGYGGRGGRGAYGRFGGYGRGGGLTVTGVNGNTIAATGRGGQAVTVQVSATTAYTEAGTSASLSDVKPGSIIAARGTNGSSATTINATGVTIILPQEVGVVTGVNGSTLTLTGFDGATRTVTVTSSTRYQKAGQGSDLSAIASGTAIAVEGTANGDGSLTAVRVTIQVPRVVGQVTAVNGSSITVMGRDGIAVTISTTGGTTYADAAGATASASMVRTGAFIIAEGTLSGDGKTLTAQRIVVAPMGAGRGFGRHGGFGRQGFGYGAGAPNGGVAGSSPTTSSPTGTTNF